MLKLMGKKYSQFYAQKLCLPWPMYYGFPRNLILIEPVDMSSIGMNKDIFLDF